ncbi:immunoglobulin domain-containing protein [Butyricimonas hominis]|uniref:immunoglobulin domain-containing protein n=1 Tax=Butyricimonas TaxID=574697 RepID=UPI003518CD8A
MKKKILFVLVLFFMLAGFDGESRIVEHNGVNLQERFSVDYEAPEIVEKPKVRVSESGNLITMEVRFKGNPAPSVTWYHNLREIIDNAGDRYTIRVFADDYGTITTVLEIENPGLEDDGFYKIRLKNKAGETTATIRLAFGEEV